MRDRLRLAELLAALSVATDLGMGQPPEKAVRSCLLATGLARSLRLPGTQVGDVYYAALLRHLGCTATASVEARLYGGDELVSRAAAEPADFGRADEMLALMLGTGRGTGLRRPALIARSAVGDLRHGKTVFRSVCEAAALLARRLGMAQEVEDSLYQQFERWDGRGAPRRLAGEEISPAARIGEVATQAVLFHRTGGPDAALAMVERRAGGWFDPSVAAAFRVHGAGLLAEIDAGDPWAAVLETEPSPERYIARAELDRVARAFGDMVDLKAPYTLGHSAGVAELADGAAHTLGLSDAVVADLRVAAFLHDLGRVAVSSGIWDKTGPLTRHDHEQIRLHPYRTERILACSPLLEPLGRMAGLHHERLDGSGYHHGLTAPALPLLARVLAAADTFQSATQDRPHRPARSPAEAAELLTREAAAGRLDADCVGAVVVAAGQAPGHPRPRRPAGLTDREVDVIRLLARGRSNKEIANRLVISRRTAEHHVQHIYDKIGHSTRAAAALFAMEHDLLRG
ncbi:HD domain-containing phosphohydrolase [Streptomyces sp. KLOTTS4A1]|uniref:HD domain-containing phosphohydrolase n=1 Tax=Streptomyces sp. KLOTTS4A1 TaxID=3390996 RepID=UPI0039F63826